MFQSTRTDNLSPVADFKSFVASEELRGIHRLVTLPPGTCTHRAASKYIAAQAEFGHDISLAVVASFDRAICMIRDNPDTMMLVPKLHDARQRLAQKSHFQELPSQGFYLPNPGLFIAEPQRNQSERTYLWALPTLLPLVKESFPDGLPFEEVVPARSTQEAAEHCGKIFGGGFCVTNEEGLARFFLKPVMELRHIVMRWYLYHKRGNLP